jgi:hypothetical protein
MKYLLAAILALAIVGTVHADPREPTLTVVADGNTYTVSGTDFGPNRDLYVNFVGPTNIVETDHDGTFSFSVTADLEPGIYRVLAETQNNLRFVASTTIEVQ